jgi:hypothetical protein
MRRVTIRISADDNDTLQQALMAFLFSPDKGFPNLVPNTAEVRFDRGEDMAEISFDVTE